MVVMTTAPESEGDLVLAAYLREQGIEAELVRPGAPTPSVKDAALALGVPSGTIIKSLVFQVEDEALLVIAAGEARIAYKRLAAALGTSRKKIRLAAPDAVVALSGFAVGAMPPFGHARRLPTYVDSLSVHRGDTVYGGGGTDSALMRVAVDTLLEVTEAHYLPLSDAPVEGAATEAPAPGAGVAS